jgi:hypothetical protein
VIGGHENNASSFYNLFWAVCIRSPDRPYAGICLVSGGENQKADTVLLADGTPIHLVLMDDLQGKKLQVKQTVHFKVRQDLVVDSKLIVQNRHRGNWTH